MPFDCSFPTGYSYYLGKRSRYLIWITKSKLDELKKNINLDKRQDTLCVSMFLFCFYLLFIFYFLIIIQALLQTTLSSCCENPKE